MHEIPDLLFRKLNPQLAGVKRNHFINIGKIFELKDLIRNSFHPL